MKIISEKEDKNNGEVHLMRSRIHFKQNNHVRNQDSSKLSDEDGNKDISWDKSKSSTSGSRCYSCDKIVHFIRNVRAKKKR